MSDFNTAPLEELVSRVLHFGGVCERMLHDRDASWEVRLGGTYLPADIVLEEDDKIGLRVVNITPLQALDAYSHPVIVCNGEDVLWMPGIVPANAREFTLWLMLLPTAVA